jgi:hypothetical protein
MGNRHEIGTYLRKTLMTKTVMRMPVELNDMAPIAQPDSGLKYTSGMSWQNSLCTSGIVPLRQVIHCVSSVGLRICKRGRHIDYVPRFFLLAIKHNGNYIARAVLNVFTWAKLYSTFSVLFRPDSPFARKLGSEIPRKIIMAICIKGENNGFSSPDVQLATKLKQRKVLT